MDAGTSLCAVLLFAWLSSFAAAQQNITAESGQSVTLTCRGPNNYIHIVEWSRADLGQKSVLIYRDGHPETDMQHPSFKNRVDLQDKHMKDGDVSVILKNVTVNDTGTYECHVFQKQMNRWKRANLKTAPITIIYLRVVVPPPGPSGGDTEDGGKEDGRKDGSVGLIVGLSVPALLLLVAAVGFLIYRKKRQNQDPYHPPVELQPV